MLPNWTVTESRETEPYFGWKMPIWNGYWLMFGHNRPKAALVQIPPKSDGAQLEPTELECENPFSVDFNKEVDGEILLHDPSAHAFPARIVARVRKRPYSSTQQGALSRKTSKNFCYWWQRQSLCNRFSQWKPSPQRDNGWKPIFF